MSRIRRPKYIGNDYDIDLIFLSNGLPIDITDWIIFYTVKLKNALPDDDAVISKTIDTHVSNEDGISLIEVSAAETVGLTPGEYHYDIKVKKSNGKMRTVIKDFIQFNRPVSIRIS